MGLTSIVCALGWSAEGHADEPLRPAYWRAAAEVGAVLAGGTIRYVIEDRPVLDFDSPSLRDRFSAKAWRFDNNAFGINYAWHPGEGALIYLLARGNRVGVYPALVYAVAGSTVWEIVLEFNEKVSINDMWTTPVSGLPVGEFVHKLALHFAHPSRSPTARALAWTLGLPVYGHRRLDGVDGRDVAAGEEAPPSWSEASFRYGFGLATNRRDASAEGAHLLAGSARFVSLPGYRSPDTFGRWFHEAELATLDLRLDLGPRSLGVDGFTEVLLAGYHAQAGSRLANTVAIAPSFTLRTSRAFGFDDRQAITGFPALAWEGRAAVRGCTASLGARAALGFGSMSAPSFALYGARFPDTTTKTVLRREGYAFGWDLKTRGDAALGCGALDVRGAVSYDRFVSIQGLDRNQEEITDDARVLERALHYEVSAWLSPEPLPLSFGVSFDARLRTSAVSAFEGSFGGYRTLANVEIRL